MGFTTSFVGGITLTTSLLYLTLHIHRQNRIHQSDLLRQQRTILKNLYDPPSPSELNDSPAYEVRPAGLTEQLKDRWNRELSLVVRNLQEKDWQQTRQTVERSASNIWHKLGGEQKVEELTKQAEQVGDKLDENITQGAKVINTKVAEGAQQAQHTISKGAKQAGKQIAESASVANEKLHQGAQQAQTKLREGVSTLQDNIADGAQKVRDGVQSAKESVRDAVERGENDAKRKGQEIRRDVRVATGQKRLLEL